MRARQSHRPVIVGQLATDDLHINVDYPSTPEYLTDVTQTLGTHSWIYFGPFPGRDNDGTKAVTLTLPDLDGITRHTLTNQKARTASNPTRHDRRKATGITRH